MRSGIEVAKGVSLGGALPDIWIPESRYLTTKAYVGAAAAAAWSPGAWRTRRSCSSAGGPRAGFDVVG